MTFTTPRGQPLAHIPNKRTMKPTAKRPRQRRLLDIPEYLAIFTYCFVRNFEKQRSDDTIMVIPVISTKHITRDDGRLLVKEGRDRTGGVVIFPRDDNGGHIVCINEEYDEQWQFYSAALNLIVRSFRQHGYRYLRIDSDGPEIPDLPTFKW